MRFIFFVIFVIGAVSASTIYRPEARISASASASACATGGTATHTSRTTRTGGSASASASATSSSTYSAPCATSVVVPCQPQAVEPCVDVSQVNFKQMSSAEVEAFRAANPDCRIVVRKVSCAPCVVRTPCASLVREIAPCAPPPCVIYNPCRTIPVPCQTKVVRKRISSSSSASSSVSKTVAPVVTITKTADPCAPTTTTIVKKMDPVQIEAKASATATIDQAITPTVVC